jgi:membrane dipeptidase
MIQAQPYKYTLVETHQDLLSAKRDNKLALGFWLQGSNPLANDIHMVETYYRLGVRYMLLCYNTRNAIGDGVIEPNDGGLSQFGRQVVAEMNRVGMLIDLSHTGIKTTLDVMSQSKHPVIFSHSNAASVTSHVRNVTDEQLIALGRNGGLIGINGLALFLGEKKSSAKKMIAHIDYIADLIGPEHVGLGLDLVYFHEILPLFYQKAGNIVYPSGYVQSMDSFQIEQVDQIIEGLLRKGYGEEVVKGILGENFLRVVQQVWQ